MTARRDVAELETEHVGEEAHARRRGRGSRTAHARACRGCAGPGRRSRARARRDGRCTRASSSADSRTASDWIGRSHRDPGAGCRRPARRARCCRRRSSVTSSPCVTRRALTRSTSSACSALSDELDELPVGALDDAQLVPAVSRGEDSRARLGQPELVVERAGLVDPRHTERHLGQSLQCHGAGSRPSTLSTCQEVFDIAAIGESASMRRCPAAAQREPSRCTPSSEATSSTGDLRPGARLPFAELSERYGGSTSAIREGLQRLVEQGLVVSEPQLGFRVVSAVGRRPRTTSRSRAARSRAWRCGTPSNTATSRGSPRSWPRCTRSITRRRRRHASRCLLEDWVAAHRRFHAGAHRGVSEQSAARDRVDAARRCRALSPLVATGRRRDRGPRHRRGAPTPRRRRARARRRRSGATARAAPARHRGDADQQRQAADSVDVAAVVRLTAAGRSEPQAGGGSEWTRRRARHREHDLQPPPRADRGQRRSLAAVRRSVRRRQQASRRRPAAPARRVEPARPAGGHHRRRRCSRRRTRQCSAEAAVTARSRSASPLRSRARSPASAQRTSTSSPASTSSIADG